MKSFRPSLSFLVSAVLFLSSAAIAQISDFSPPPFDRAAYENWLAARTMHPRVGGVRLARFDGWDDALVRGPGQTFYDVFGDGGGVDITVSAAGTYSREFRPGQATTYNPSRNQIGTSAGNEWNQLTFRLNTANITPSPFGIGQFSPASLFVYNQTLGSNESVRVSSLSGGRVSYDQVVESTPALPTPIGNGTNVVEVRGTDGTTDGNFVFSKPSSFSVTFATEKDYSWQTYKLGRVVKEHQPFAGDSNEFPSAVFPSEGRTEFARFDGWDDETIRSTGQRFEDVFGDGRVNVTVSTRGTYSRTGANAQSWGTQFPHGQSPRIATTASDEWNSLIFRVDPVDGSSDIGGTMFLNSESLRSEDLIRVAALDGSPLEYQRQFTGKPADVTYLARYSASVQGTGNGADANSGTFELEASSFSLTYATDSPAAYQFFQIGRYASLSETLDACSARQLILDFEWGGGNICRDLQEAELASLMPTLSASAVPEPELSWATLLGAALVLRRRRSSSRG